MSNEAIVDFLLSVDMLSTLTREEASAIGEQCESLHFEFGDTVLSTGDSCDGMFIVKSGAVRLFTVDNEKEISLGIRKTTEVFAEVAALRDYAAEYTVRASSKTDLLKIPRAAFSTLFSGNREAEAFISRVAAIATAGGLVTQMFKLRGKIPPEQTEKIFSSIGIKRIRAGTTVLEQGSKSDRRLYFLRSGQVSLTRAEEGREYPLANLSRGDVFGEKACLLHQEQMVSVHADTDTVLLVIPEDTVKLVLEHNPKIKAVLEGRISSLERELNRQKKLAEMRRRPALLDLKSRASRGEKVIKRFPLVEQAEEMDCGAACLAMICKHYGIVATLGKLRELANVTTEGATMDSLARVGESLGFTTRGVKCTYQSLLGFEMPFIAHWEGYHYIVVYGISKSHIWIADPGVGFRKMTVEDFEKGWTGNCLLFSPGTNMVELSTERSPWFRFINFLKPYKKLLGYLLLATLVIDLLGIAPPLIIQNILDRVIVHQNQSLLHLLIVGLVIASVFTQLTTLLRGYLSNFMLRNLDFSMMTNFCKHTFSLPLSFFAKRRTGDIFARFQENETIRDFLTQSTISTILNLLMVFIYFTVLFMYNVKMTLLLIALVIPILALTVLITPKIKNYARRSFEATTDAEAVLMESITGAETIKAMGIEYPMRLKWEQRYAKALGVNYRAGQFDILVNMVTQLLNATITIVILWTGANLVLNQQLTVGQLIAFNALMGSVMSPLMGLVGLWDELHEAGVAMERLGDVLDIEPEQKPDDMSSRILLPDMDGQITLENVYFRYGGKETPYVLENISFEMNAGDVVAVVGQSGSGKSTLAKLLVGFYPPSEGRILIDGYDLSLLDKDYYRVQIGYVMQSNLLFSGTIAENIALGDQNPDRRKILEVAKLADAHGFVSSMPLGYEQVVGERGVGLSGGQMQRLCIARALYRDPHFLVFDEATSALDTQSESNIMSNMRGILRGRTAIVIAHRLSTIMSADKIVVLYEGSVVEQGTHDELYTKQGMYHQLVEKQLGPTR